MIVLASIIITYFIAIEIAKKIRSFNFVHYLIAAALALIPVVVGLYHMFTMEKPPLF